MVNLLKTFGRGVLYVLGLPFFILALLIFAVFGIFAFLFQAIKSIIFFFTGQRFFPELPEDKELKLLKEKQNASFNENIDREPEKDIIMPYSEIKDLEEPQEELMNNLTKESASIAPSEKINDQEPLTTVEDACFKSSFEEEIKEEPAFEDTNENIVLNDLLEEEQPEIEEINQNIELHENDTILETTQKKENEENLVEELETYVPRSSNYSAADEDEDTNNGVDIDYNVR